MPDLPPISKSSLPLISRIYEDWFVRQRSICRGLMVVVEIPKFESGRFAELIGFPKFFDNAGMRGLSNDWLSSTVLDLSQLLNFRRQMKLVWFDYAQLTELFRSKYILVRQCSICRFVVLFSRIVSVSLILFNSTRTDELRQISEDVGRSIRFSLLVTEDKWHWASSCLRVKSLNAFKHDSEDPNTYIKASVWKKHLLSPMETSLINSTHSKALPPEITLHLAILGIYSPTGRT